jgi:hypothetical protein
VSEVRELAELIELYGHSHVEMAKRVAELEGERCQMMTDINVQSVRMAELQAQLDRANESLEEWKQRAARMALKAKPLLDRATEPRADSPSESLMDAARRAVASQESAAPEPDDWPQRLAESIVADAALDETTVAYYPQEPRPMSEAPRVWSGPETHITVDVWKYGWTPTGPRWRGAHHRLSTGEIFVLMTFDKPEQPPAGLLAVCSKVDWLPTSSGGEDSDG